MAPAEALRWLWVQCVSAWQGWHRKTENIVSPPNGPRHREIRSPSGFGATTVGSWNYIIKMTREWGLGRNKILTTREWKLKTWFHAPPISSASDSIDVVCPKVWMTEGCSPFSLLDYISLSILSNLYKDAVEQRLTDNLLALPVCRTVDSCFTFEKRVSVEVWIKYDIWNTCWLKRQDESLRSFLTGWYERREDVQVQRGGFPGYS